jgi:RHS repeat-associated protein
MRWSTCRPGALGTAATGSRSRRTRRAKRSPITAKTETIGGVETAYGYTYDAAGQLASEIVDGATVASYSYDANGNRLIVTRQGGPVSATYDDQDRLNSYGATTFTYGANGELSGRTASGETTSYATTRLGNLVSVDLPDSIQIAYVVDGNNRRVGRKVDGVLTQGWLYRDDLKPIAELDSSGNVVAKFVYATQANVPDYLVKGGVTYRNVTDHLGCVRLVLDADMGLWSSASTTTPFGRVLADSNPGFQPFGFAGGLCDPATGLVRFGARDYDSLLGRWTSKDPLGFDAQDANLYAYSYNSPLDYVDATGRKPGRKFKGSHAVNRAAVDAMKWINPTSKRWNVETCGMVCKNSSNETFATHPVWGSLTSQCIPTMLPDGRCGSSGADAACGAPEPGRALGVLGR